jgi:2-phospho-L-lactate transferase/gluconeogenesis factor (CofD/UPF0052 family)
VPTPHDWTQTPTVPEVEAHYARLKGIDYVVPGGGHGAAAVCRPLLARGRRVAGVANPIDEGGHSARLRWALYQRLGYWTIIPGDTMNLLGGGFANQAVYAVTNTRLPKDLGDTPADEVFVGAVESALAKAAPADRPALEAFREFVRVVGKTAQEQLVAPGLASLAGASFQNVLHAATMLHAQAYREGRDAIDEDQYLVGSYLLERAMGVPEQGRVLPMSFTKVTLVTEHAGGRKVVGGINRVLLAKGCACGHLYYNDLVPASMIAGAEPETEEEERAKLAAAKVVDWYAADVYHGPITEPFNNDWIFGEVRPLCPPMNPRLAAVLRALGSGGMLVIPPGNCHESTYTFFLLAGVLDEIMAARQRGARVVLVCNPVNLLFSAGYTVRDYLRSVEQALRQSCGREVPVREVLDRVIINDPTTAPESVQRMMRGEGIDPVVKQELLHRTPAGPVTVDREELAALEAEGIEVVHRDMLEIQPISIRGIQTEAVSYHPEKLTEALLA